MPLGIDEMGAQGVQSMSNMRHRRIERETQMSKMKMKWQKRGGGGWRRSRWGGEDEAKFVGRM